MNFPYVLEDDVLTILREIALELALAREKHPAFNSRHEGYAVILEEMDELWKEIKQRDVDAARTRSEAVQVAAMAIRFLVDCEKTAGVTEDQ